MEDLYKYYQRVDNILYNADFNRKDIFEFDDPNEPDDTYIGIGIGLSYARSVLKSEYYRQSMNEEEDK